MVSKIINKRSLFTLSVVALFLGCSDDDLENHVRPEPIISIDQETVQRTVNQGNEIILELNLEGQAGLKEFEVTRNGEPFHHEELISGRVSTTYQLKDQAETQIFQVGDEISYNFTLTDRQERSTQTSHIIQVTESKPFIDLIEDGTEPMAIVGDSTRIDMVLVANVGLKSLETYKDGESINFEEFQETESRKIYEFRDFLDGSEYTNDQKVVYEFELIDASGNSDTFSYEITILENLFTINPVEIHGETLHLISGEINIDTTLSAANKYLLDGIVTVIDGAVLGIEAGTHIYGQTDPTGGEQSSALSITTGAKIMAEGSVDKPIVFTSLKTLSGSPAPGDWSGIYINGLASTNDTDTSLTPYTGNYGGSDDQDDSGILRYVVIEYAGKSINGRGGGLNLNGVGNGSTLEFIQVVRADTDGVRLRGGTVNLRYLLTQDNEDRGMRWQDGWRGFGQFWIFVMKDGSGTALSGRNNDNNISEPIDPRSNPTLSNLVFVGSGSEIGLRFRRQSIGQAYNGIVTGFEEGVDADNNLQDEIVDGLLVIRNFHSFGNDTNYAGSTDTFLNNPMYNNYDSPINLNGYVGASATNALDPTTLDPWFAPALFIGAVQPGNDWTQGWTR